MYPLRWRTTPCAVEISTRERMAKATGTARRSAVLTTWPVSGLMRRLSPNGPPSRACCTVAYGQFSHIYRCGGSVGIARESAPIFPFHLSGYPEQAPSGQAKVTVGGRLCQAPRHGPHVQHWQSGAIGRLPRKTTPDAPPPSEARPPPKRLCFVAQQRSIDGGFPAEARRMRPASSQVRLCFGEAISGVLVARLLPPPAQQRRVFARKNGGPNGR